MHKPTIQLPGNREYEENEKRREFHKKKLQERVKGGKGGVETGAIVKGRRGDPGAVSLGKKQITLQNGKGGKKTELVEGGGGHVKKNEKKKQSPTAGDG